MVRARCGRDAVEVGAGEGERQAGRVQCVSGCCGAVAQERCEQVRRRGGRQVGSAGSVQGGMG